MQKMKPLSGAELRAVAAQYGINQLSEVAVLDTSYRTFLSSIQKFDSVVAKNHYQPLQASYYDATGNLQSFHINCYTSGFPNLNWDQKSKFQQFPPLPQAPTDTLLPISTYLRYLRTPEGLSFPKAVGAEYTVVVQWSRFMGRQSRRLIEIVQQNATLARRQGKSIRLIFVSNDNFEFYLTSTRLR